ncbi:hypothetical protein M9H77_29825 [Catharanthus roseus]|uniref:Uncharacterized protein n=1 Tax=Catharanthus roseus TaxID=4058 RepID=A0ACB9ZXQ2_CATRO|nr:hypothetical protein M9H77_29825 [Catharanthus roseus]
MDRSLPRTVGLNLPNMIGWLSSCSSGDIAGIDASCFLAAPPHIRHPWSPAGEDHGVFSPLCKRARTSEGIHRPLGGDASSAVQSIPTLSRKSKKIFVFVTFSRSLDCKTHRILKRCLTSSTWKSHCFLFFKSMVFMHSRRFFVQKSILGNLCERMNNLHHLPLFLSLMLPDEKDGEIKAKRERTEAAGTKEEELPPMFSPSFGVFYNFRFREKEFGANIGNKNPLNSSSISSWNKIEEVLQSNSKFHQTNRDMRFGWLSELWVKSSSA